MTWRPRDAAAFAHAMIAQMATGEIWPRTPSSTLVRAVTGLAGVVGRWASRCGTFLRTEAFPPSSLDMLPDWERVLGLPEPCLPVTSPTISERQLQVSEKLARRPGRQDRAYFVDLAARLGYTITLTEYIPAQCGVTQCGVTVTDTDTPYAIAGAGCGTPAIRYVWSITVTGPRLTWFAVGAGGGRAATDPHLKIRRAEDLECLLGKLKPAHTKLIFDYTGA